MQRAVTIDYEQPLVPNGVARHEILRIVQLDEHLYATLTTWGEVVVWHIEEAALCGHAVASVETDPALTCLEAIPPSFSLGVGGAPRRDVGFATATSNGVVSLWRPRINARALSAASGSTTRSVAAATYAYWSRVESFRIPGRGNAIRSLTFSSPAYILVGVNASQQHDADFVPHEKRVAADERSSVHWLRLKTTATSKFLEAHDAESAVAAAAFIDVADDAPLGASLGARTLVDVAAHFSRSSEGAAAPKSAAAARRQNFVVAYTDRIVTGQRTVDRYASVDHVNVFVPEFAAAPFAIRRAVLSNDGTQLAVVVESPVERGGGVPSSERTFIVVLYAVNVETARIDAAPLWRHTLEGAAPHTLCFRANSELLIDAVKPTFVQGAPVEWSVELLSARPARTFLTFPTPHKLSSTLFSANSGGAFLLSSVEWNQRATHPSIAIARVV